MESVWQSTKVGIKLAGAHYDEGYKERNFNQVIEAPTAEQLAKFGQAIAKLGQDDEALGANITTTRAVNF